MCRLFRTALFTGVALSTLFSSGCLSRSEVTSDIRNAREARYEGWVNRGTSEEQPAPLTGALSLEESILTALGNSRPVQIALLQRETASARVMEARSEALPTVTADATYLRRDIVTRVAPGGNTLGELDNYALGGHVTQPLYKGGAVSAGIRAARIYTVLVDEQLRGTYQSVIYNTRKAYYDAQLARELVKADDEAVRVASAHLDDVEKNFAAGMVASFDVLRSKVEISNLTAQQVQDQNRYHLAMTSLYNLIGVSQDSTATLSTPLVYEPFSPPDMDKAVQKAFMYHTDLLQGELNVRLLREALAVSKAPFWPELHAFFDSIYARPDPQNSLVHDWGRQWSAGLQATYTIFEGFKAVAQARQAEISLRQSQVTLYDTEQHVLLQVRQALLNLEDAVKFVNSQQANVEQATEALRLARLGFNQGIRKQVEVDDALSALTTALANLAQALYNHQVAKLDFEQATGTLAPVEPPPGSPLPPPASGKPQ